MATYEPHWNLSQYHCPFCSTPHPLDLITFVAECCTMDTFRQEMLQAWPSPFNVTTAVWWESQDVTNRRHFVRTLVPKSLAPLFLTPPANKILAEHKADLRIALGHRRSAVTTVLKKTHSRLHSHPPPLPPPPVFDNLWGTPFAVYSTSRAPSPPKPATYSPPPLPSSVKRRTTTSKRPADQPNTQGQNTKRCRKTTQQPPTSIPRLNRRQKHTPSTRGTQKITSFLQFCPPSRHAPPPPPPSLSRIV